jgi:hypothetical protein
MAGFGFRITNNANNRGAKAAVLGIINWLLAGGFWSDAGAWRDNENWTD